MKATLVLLVVLLGAACANDTPHEHSYLGSHGMALLFGPDGRIFAHHLPLYQRPHDYQLIYEVVLKTDVERARLRELASRPQITVLPVDFDLRRLVNGESTTLQTTVFDGHFERGGQRLFDVALTYDRPIYVRKIDVTGDTLGHFDLVPIASETSLAVHRIASRPSLDAVGWVPARDERRLVCPTTITNLDAVTRTLTECLGRAPVYLELQDFSR